MNKRARQIRLTKGAVRKFPRTDVAVTLIARIPHGMYAGQWRVEFPDGHEGIMSRAEVLDWTVEA